MARKINIQITFVDGKRQIKTLRGVSGEVRSLRQTAQTHGMRFGRIMDVALGNLAANAANTALNALRGLVTGGIRFLSDSLEKGGIQLIAERKLEQAIKNAGEETEKWTPKLKAAAAEVQNLSNFGDEEIITAQAMLLSFQEVAGPQGAELLTSRLADTAAGIAKVTGETSDLNSVSTLMGRALTTGASALTRVGVSLSDTQKDAFDAAEGLDKVRILAEILDGNFRGLAEATRDPLKQLKNTIGDIQEEIALQFIPAVHEGADELRAFFQTKEAKEFAKAIGQKLGNALRSAIEYMKENQDEVKAFGDDLASIAESIAGLIKTGQSLFQFMGDVESDLQSVVEFFDVLTLGDIFGIDESEKQSEQFLQLLRRTGSEVEDQIAFIRSLQQSEDDEDDGSSTSSGDKKLEEQKKLAEEARALKREGDRLFIEMMKEGLEKELQQIDFEFEEKRRIIQEKFPKQSDELLKQLEAFRERARDAAFGLGDVLDLDEDLLIDNTFTEVVEGITTTVVMSQEEMSRAVEEGVLARAQAYQDEQQALAGLEAARAQALAAQIETSAREVSTLREAADAAIAIIRREITALVAKAVAAALSKHIGSLGIIGLATAPFLALAINKTLDSLIPKFAAGGLASGLVRTGEQGPEFIVNARATRRHLPLLAAINAGAGRAPAASGADLAHEIRLLRRDFRTIQIVAQATTLQGALEQQARLDTLAGNA